MWNQNETLEGEIGEMEGEIERPGPIFRDIRRYYCDYCGICRSKKSLITSHLLTHHKQEIEKENADKRDKEKEEKKSNTCEECGASFRKSAHLKQHMQSHSLERPFRCPVGDCNSSYRRKDHLNRHLLQHQGKLFSCSVESCDRKFAYLANMKRHVMELHDEANSSSFCEGPKQYVCQEEGCGKVFRYASKLRKHEESHVKLDTVEAICGELGCLKSFSNVECLKAHIQSCHQYIHCDLCGTKQLKKNFKRHMRIHEAKVSSERIKCSFEGCLHTFSNKSNLIQHVKAVHLELRPFACRISGCGKTFPFRHVRDNHEKTGTHFYIQGDFEASDEAFRSRPRGGCKRKYPNVIEMLQRKRVVPPSEEDPALNHGSDYLAWLLSASEEDQQ